MSQDYENLQFGDEVKFNEQWSALVGVNRTVIQAVQYGTTSAVTSDYDKAALTPTVSLRFKPLPWITTYATYMQGLQSGGVVSTMYKKCQRCTSSIA